MLTLVILLVISGLGLSSNITQDYVVRQRQRADGSVEIYSPYILFNTQIASQSDTLSYPLVLYSSNGLLDITLTIEAARITTKPFDFTSRVFCYSGICNTPGPTLNIKPGERVRIKLVNKLSPSGPAGANRTNLFMQSFPLTDTNSPYHAIDGGSSWQYDYTIPIDMAPGLHWYYSRVHGVAAMQVMGGLAGALVISKADLLTYPASFADLRAHLLVLTHVFVDKDPRVLQTDPVLQYSLQDEDLVTSSLSLTYLSHITSSSLPLAINYHPIDNSILHDVWFVNGLYQPLLRVQPSEWRLVDVLVASGDRFVELELRTDLGYAAGDSACELRLLARNGAYFPSSRMANHLVLLQGERAALAMRCAERGTFYLQTVSTFNKSDSDAHIGDYQTKSNQLLMKIIVSGADFIMDDLPTDLSFLIPNTTAVDTVMAFSISTAQNNSKLAVGPSALVDYGLQGDTGAAYVLGIGSDCRPPCFDRLLCSSLFGDEDYTLNRFPTVANGHCTYGEHAIQGSTAGALLTIWGTEDYPYPLYFPGTTLELVSFENVHRNISNILIRDSYSPFVSYDMSAYGAVGDSKDIWPALPGKAVYKMRFKGDLNVFTSFLKFADKGMAEKVRFSVLPANPVPAPTPAPTPATPSAPDPVYHDIPVINADALNASSLCAINGSSFAYTESINALDGLRVISVSSCPNHYSNCQSAQCNGDLKTRAMPLRETISVPLFPRLIAAQDVSCSLEKVGIALNGVGIYGPADHAGICLAHSAYRLSTSTGSSNYTKDAIGRTTCSLPGRYDGIQYCGNVLDRIGKEVDKCGGHADYMGGVYKYHTLPVCLLDQITSATASAGNSTSAGGSVSKHSPQIGWAMDGFPIYGPFGIKGIAMKPCGQGHPQLCLDNCNGYYGRLSVDEYLYRYYLPSNSISTACSDDCDRLSEKCCSSALPEKSFFPFTLGCLKGCIGEACRGPRAVTDRFIPSVSQFVTAVNLQSYSDVSMADGGNMAVSPMTALSAPAAAVPGISVALGTNGTYNIITHEPLTRALALYTYNNTNMNKTILPMGSNDAYITSISENGEDLYFTTQREILMYNGTSKGEPSSPSALPCAPRARFASSPLPFADPSVAVTSTIISGLVSVDIFGYNLGFSSADLVYVKYGSALCTSLVFVTSMHIQATCVQAQSLAYASEPQGVEEEVDVEIRTLSGMTHGLSPNAYEIFHSKSFRPVIADITVTVVPFQPGCVHVVGGWVYWANLGREQGIQRALLDGTQVETVLNHVRTLCVELLS